MKFSKLHKILFNKIADKLFNLNLILIFKNMKKIHKNKFINLMILNKKKHMQKK